MSKYSESELEKRAKSPAKFEWEYDFLAERVKVRAGKNVVAGDESIKNLTLPEPAAFNPDKNSLKKMRSEYAREHPEIAKQRGFVFTKHGRLIKIKTQSLLRITVAWVFIVAASIEVYRFATGTIGSKPVNESAIKQVRHMSTSKKASVSSAVSSPEVSSAVASRSEVASPNSASSNYDDVSASDVQDNSNQSVNATQATTAGDTNVVRTGETNQTTADVIAQGMQNGMTGEEIAASLNAQ
jgi:hypothetical protein